MMGHSQNAGPLKVLYSYFNGTCIRYIWNANEFCLDLGPIPKISQSVYANILKSEKIPKSEAFLDLGILDNEYSTCIDGQNYI